MQKTSCFAGTDIRWPTAIRDSDMVQMAKADAAPFEPRRARFTGRRNITFGRIPARDAHQGRLMADRQGNKARTRGRERRDVGADRAAPARNHPVVNPDRALSP
jgi:hypothetical protein